MSKRAFIGIAGLLGSALLCANDSHASDDKWYAGASCNQALWADDTGPSAATRWNGTMANTSATHEVTVLCPLVRDSAQISSATFKVYDRHPTRDVHCWLFFEIAIGNQVFRMDDYEKTTSYGPQVKTLSFGAVTGGESYYAQCELPRTSSGMASHIAMLKVREP